MYKILFIDEEKETLGDFADYVDEFSSKVKLEVVTQLPFPTLEEMIDFVINVSPDALITDYRLNEKRVDIDYNVPYNGVDLVEKFQSIRNYFPCFVLTALDDEAVKESEDVNIVYIKNILYNKEESPAKAKFLDRVVTQIEHYNFKISNATEELKQLVEKKKSGEVDFKIENRIIELDSFLERTIDGENAIPMEFKSSSNFQRLDSIIDKVDSLLKKLDEGDGK